MKEKVTKRKSFEIPRSVLNQLNEFSSGGYLLITLNEEGSPVLNENLTSSAAIMLIPEYANMWSEAQKNINRSFVFNNTAARRGVLPNNG